jgi:hypothetical protein
VIVIISFGEVVNVMNMKVLALKQVAHSKNVLLVEYFRNFFLRCPFVQDIPKIYNFVSPVWKVS